MLEQNDLLPVEVGGEEIGDAYITEITDDYIEVAFMGHTFKVSPNIVNHFEMRRDLGRYYG